MKGLSSRRASIVYGFYGVCTRSFGSTAVVEDRHRPMHKSGDEVLGGHAVDGSRARDSTRRFIVPIRGRKRVGGQGIFLMPTPFLSWNSNLSDELWPIRL